MAMRDKLPRSFVAKGAHTHGRTKGWDTMVTGREGLYDLIYALAARDGRDTVLFGKGATAAREAFARGLCGDVFPELWFELPLAEDPWFDMHMLVSREDMRGGEAFADLDGTYADVLAWFAQSEDTRQLALSFDSGSGDARHPAVQLLLDIGSMAVTQDFLSAVGRADLADSYRSFVERMPKGWYACYSGVFPARPDTGWVRVECIVGEEAQRSYADDPESLSAHLAQVGIGDVDGEMLSHTHELARSNFPLELQFDVGRDGHALPRLGTSVRFQPHDWTDSDASEHVEELLSKAEGWGLADDRWRHLRETAFAKRATLGKEAATLWCFPAFLKIRWREDNGLDAKAYLMAGAH